jgi:uncharacterized protein (DUF1501 family)
MMQPNRRDFLRLGLGSSTLLACGGSVPLFLARSARAAESRANTNNILVVVQLDGGNDGLNTIVPYSDDEYRKARPRLRIDKKAVVPINDRLGFHPSLKGFARLLQNHRLAIVQGVGYPNSTRSHFEDMAVWHTCRNNAPITDPGWLARSLDAMPVLAGRDTAAIHFGNNLLPQDLSGSKRQVTSLASLEQFRRRLNLPEAAGAAQQRAALDEIGAQTRGTPGSLLEFVEQAAVLTYTSSARLQGMAAHDSGAPYPQGMGLAKRLRTIAQLIQADLSTSIYYTQLDGFDTHANQLPVHAELLQEAGESLESFINDLVKSGHDRRVVVLVFSEFGRRVAENSGAGTDHGTAAPLFLLGTPVKPGVHGPYPNLQELVDGDPRPALDLRRVYATLLEKWLVCPAEKVLGGKYESLDLI